MRSEGVKVVLYSCPGCRLCEIAERVLRAELDRRGIPLEKVDIHSDPEIKARFETEIPVVEIEGKVVFRHHVNAIALSRTLDDCLGG